MPDATFDCFLVEKDAQGQVRRGPARRTLDELPAGDVLIAVEYSSLNYKDALSASGHPGVTRNYPHIPGVDAAGTIVESTAAEFRAGDDVLVTGYDLGQDTWGGFAQYVRVPAGWVVPRPKRLTARQAMIFGTAGFTAAQCVDALLSRGLVPETGEVLVTGATGGVGSVAVAILSKLGFRVAAVTGKTTAGPYLERLGAASILGREAVHDDSGKPLLSARWAAAVDTVGGTTLATVVRSLAPRGTVACCGLVGGTELPLSVFPFILRGVALVGIDSATCPQEIRRRLWLRLAAEWKPDQLEDIATAETDLAGLDEHIERILAGQVTGRVLVRPTR